MVANLKGIFMSFPFSKLLREWSGMYGARHFKFMIHFLMVVIGKRLTSS